MLQEEGGKIVMAIGTIISVFGLCGAIFKGNSIGLVATIVGLVITFIGSEIWLSDEEDEPPKK